jgi:hypothetical protein
VAVFPVVWLIQRHSEYTAAAVFLLPIFVVILALTKPDYGAEFWRIFRYEVYLNPVYVPRGLLICFLLLSPGIFTRAVIKKGDGWREGDKTMTLVLCFLIGFAVTGWEALITPAPPHTFEGGSGWFAGQWTEVMHAGWRTVSLYISQYIPPDYQNAVRIGVSVYPFLAFFLLLFPGYRRLPQDFIREHRESFLFSFLWEFFSVFLVGRFRLLTEAPLVEQRHCCGF